MERLRKRLSILLVYVLVLQAGAAAVVWGAQATESAKQTTGTATPGSRPTLSEVMELPSMEVAAVAEKFTYRASAVQEQIDALDKESKKRESAFKAAAKQADKQVGAREKVLANLKTTTTDPAIVRQRQLIHCQIIAIKKQVTDQTFTYLQQQIGTDVRISKLRLLQSWGAESRQIEALIAQGGVGQRRFGNVLDIGQRGSLKPFKGQQDDISWGEKELEAARQRGQFPKEIRSATVKEYVNRIAQNLARNSDLQVPLHVFVVQQEVIKNGRPVLDKNGQPQQVANAMALPGGYLIIYAGLIQAAANESEIAGVMAHEMAHVAARHARRMAKKGTVFNVASLAALIGLQLIAPGLFQAASYLSYYLKGLLLQAIFNGLGLVFTLDALGVSRDFELEADQLGMQYAWRAGYNPRGFIDLFDQMSQKEGYASRTSFFATHPAFGERILNSLKEYKVLESLKTNRKYITDTAEFQTIREEVNVSLRKTKEEVAEEENRPSLNPKEPSEQECQELLGAAAPASKAASQPEQKAPAQTAGPQADAPQATPPSTDQRQGATQPQASATVGEQSPCRAALPSGFF
jgi:Zn-dependent protease with chaperone function